MNLPALKAKYSLYLDLIKGVQDGYGFLEADKCDSLLFSCLSSIGGASVDVSQAFSGDKWLRRPRNYPECWSSGKSRSTISRDHLLGVMWWAVDQRRIFVLEYLWQYAWAHGWKMGRGRLAGADTFMNPLMMSTLASAILYLGGKPTLLLRIFSRLPHFPTRAKGYVRHVQALTLLLRKRIGRKTSLLEWWALKRNARQQPKNPLHLFAAGYVNQAAYQILQSPYWPNERLPATKDVSECWPMQRDWQELHRGIGDKKHSGGDALFVMKLILDEVENA